MSSSSINANVNLTNSSAGLNFNKIISFSSNEAASLIRVTELTTSDTEIALDTIDTPRFYGISNDGSEGSVLVGFDGVTYDQEIEPGDVLLVRLRNTDKIETQTVTTVADVSDSLDGTYLTLDGFSGTWAIWIDTDDSGTAEPAHGKDSSVEITSIVTDDTAAAVALAIYTDLIADTAFMTDFDVAYDATADDDFITITDKFTGTRTNLADTGTTGFTVATTQEGAAGRSVHIKASVGVIETTIAVMPN